MGGSLLGQLREGSHDARPVRTWSTTLRRGLPGDLPALAEAIQAATVTVERLGTVDPAGSGLANGVAPRAVARLDDRLAQLEANAACGAAVTAAVAGGSEVAA